jgi:hypothetical protein
MSNVIQINVIGSLGTGKSTIEQEIVDSLRNLGFAVKWDVKPDYKTEEEARVTGMDRLNRLEKVADTTTVVVKSLKVKKDFNESLNYRVKDYPL